MSPKGISIVICTHNGSKYLPTTLDHIFKQDNTQIIKWEIIVVDNASTDNTREVALKSLPSNLNIPFRIVNEPEIGLIHARLKGFAEAIYEFVSFIDDDNWVASNWVSKLYELMSANPDIGACGSFNDPVSDTSLPSWFSKFHRSYAVGMQEEQTGDVTWKKGVLFGAGLTIRKTAWNQLIDKGFKPLLVGRQANELTCSEDYEICLALRLNGWRLWYDQDLRLKHFLPQNRLSWNYLKKMLRIAGYSSIMLDPYYIASRSDYNYESIYKSLKIRWIYASILTFRKIIRLFPSYLYFSLCGTEGKNSSLELEKSLGRLLALLNYREKYDDMIYNIRNAEWIAYKI